MRKSYLTSILPVTAMFVAASFMLSACSGITKGPEHTKQGEFNENQDMSKRATMFGDGGLSLFGEDNLQSGSPIGVNSFLWRASLDTISFMPVNSADPFGGVIITDWHSRPEAPNERFKLNIYILGQTLRADGIRASVFRQVLDQNGTWHDASIPEGTAIKIEDSILMKARQLRHQTIVKNE